MTRIVVLLEGSTGDRRHLAARRRIRLEAAGRWQRKRTARRQETPPGLAPVGRVIPSAPRTSSGFASARADEKHVRGSTRPCPCHPRGILCPFGRSSACCGSMPSIGIFFAAPAPVGIITSSRGGPETIAAPTGRRQTAPFASLSRGGSPVRHRSAQKELVGNGGVEKENELAVLGRCRHARPNHTSRALARGPRRRADTTMPRRADSTRRGGGRRRRRRRALMP